MAVAKYQRAMLLVAILLASERGRHILFRRQSSEKCPLAAEASTVIDSLCSSSSCGWISSLIEQKSNYPNLIKQPKQAVNVEPYQARMY